jgi:hypothetical protein
MTAGVVEEGFSCVVHVTNQSTPGSANPTGVDGEPVDSADDGERALLHLMHYVLVAIVLIHLEHLLSVAEVDAGM